MTILTKGPNDMAFILSEANGFRSREEVVVDASGGTADANGVVWYAGEVLGKITASGKYVQHDPGAADGSEAAAAVLGFNIGAVEDSRAAIVRDAEVDGQKLRYISGISAPNKTAAIADLTALGIIVR